MIRKEFSFGDEIGRAIAELTNLIIRPGEIATARSFLDRSLKERRYIYFWGTFSIVRRTLKELRRRGITAGISILKRFIFKGRSGIYRFLHYRLIPDTSFDSIAQNNFFVLFFV